MQQNIVPLKTCIVHKTFPVFILKCVYWLSKNCFLKIKINLDIISSEIKVGNGVVKRWVVYFLQFLLNFCHGRRHFDQSSEWTFKRRPMIGLIFGGSPSKFCSDEIWLVYMVHAYFQRPNVTSLKHGLEKACGLKLIVCDYKSKVAQCYIQTPPTIEKNCHRWKNSNFLHLSGFNLHKNFVICLDTLLYSQKM